MAVIRDVRGRILPGQPALNPSGRPPLPADMRAELDEIFRAAAPEAARKLVELMHTSDDDRVVAAAATHLLDRAVGKPVQNTNATVARVDLGAMHLAALKDLQARRQQAAKVIEANAAEDVR
jgi:hypothetical protein